MNEVQLERLSDLLMLWNTAHPYEPALRDYASQLRHHIELELADRNTT